ncbi:MAG: phosphoglycerate dehydrogenase, partial [Labilithrix sp.]|nr:phosphoglycerate dehydrogenase [Labilithrix sp.]
DALPSLLPNADVVVVLLPLTDATRRLVDARFLAQMREDAILLNAGRGGVVDTDALLGELSARRIHAALDVTDPEPLPSEHPLWHAPNLVLTPHVAGSTARWRERVYKLAGDQIRRFAAGEPLLNVRSER